MSEILSPRKDTQKAKADNNMNEKGLFSQKNSNHKDQLLPSYDVSEGHLSGITLTNSLLTLQHRVDSPECSRTGIPLSQLGSSVTDPSQKAESEFRQTYIFRSEHDQMISDLRNELIGFRSTNSTLQVEIGKLQVENGRLLGELSGLNVIKSLFKEKEDEIKKLNAQLIQINKGSAIDPHRQCGHTIKLLEAQIESLKEERDKYKDHRDELAMAFGKKVRKIMDEYMNESECNSTDKDQENVDEVEQVRIKVRSKHQQYVNDDTKNKKLQQCQKVSEAGVDMNAAESCEENIPEIINCKLNSNNFNGGAKAQQYPKMKQQQFDDTSNEISMIDTTKQNQTAHQVSQLQATSNVAVGTHKSEGYMRWVDGELANVTQQIMGNYLAMEKMKEFRYRCNSCKKLFSCKDGWKYHAEWMLTCGRICTCDVFSFARYSHSLEGTFATKFQREIEPKELKKLEKLIATTMKKPELIEPEKFKTVLETKRNVQREDSISFINETKEQLMLAEGWLVTLSQQCARGELKALGAPICDAIVYPRCPLIFGSDIQKHDHELMLFLKSHGVAVRTVGNTSKSDPTVAFVYLLDSDNEYTAELMLKLQQSLDDLASKIPAVVPTSELQKSIIQTQLSNLYIRQTDYTKDYLSFLIVKSLNKNFDILRQIGVRIGIPFSEAHSQLFTSIQFQSFAKDASGKQVRVQRLKAYNKWVHLLLTTSFKAALSMGTSKLFKGPSAFHMNKLQPSFNDGLLRIELSSYYYSVQQWESAAVQMQHWNQTIANMERALQEVEEQLLYKVSLKMFWDSFWFSVDAATTIIDLQADLWTIVYAYSSRSYLFTGHYTDKHAKSGAQLTFLQRFAGAKTLVKVSNGEIAKQFMIYRHGHFRQIPIGSLNVKQGEENRIPIDMAKWYYHLSKGQLDQIYFVCDNQEEFDEWFGQDPTLARPDINEFETPIDQHMSDSEEQIPLSNMLQNQYDQAVNISSQQTHYKKRESKLIEKEETKENMGMQRNRSKSTKQSVGISHTKTCNFVKDGLNKGKQSYKCSNCKRKTINPASTHCRKTIK